MTDKARSEQVAKVMERVCDLCVHPFQEADQDKLYERYYGIRSKKQKAKPLIQW